MLVWCGERTHPQDPQFVYFTTTKCVFTKYANTPTLKLGQEMDTAAGAGVEAVVPPPQDDAAATAVRESAKRARVEQRKEKKKKKKRKTGVGAGWYHAGTCSVAPPRSALPPMRTKYTCQYALTSPAAAAVGGG